MNTLFLMLAMSLSYQNAQVGIANSSVFTPELEVCYAICEGIRCSGECFPAIAGEEIEEL